MTIRSNTGLPRRALGPRPRRQPRPHLDQHLRQHLGRPEEGGAATIFVVLFTVALLAVAGLVVDGGYALAAKRAAMNHAEQAARAGADALNQGALRDGRTIVDPGRAVHAAQAYLALVGAHGSVGIDGGEVTVTVTDRQETVLLSAVGVGALPVSATATALSIDGND